jgi:demethylmenaquinone methyltransferase/2-methoxy-6-polyprenyl-1,4-benzoquinol methylase
MYKAETVVPYTDSKAKKSLQIKQMFNEIASRYDLLNRLFSLGNDRYWRKKGILSLKGIAPQKILDIATGTGDLALEAYKLLHPEKITGIDISEKMMEIATQKVAAANLSDKIDFRQCDCCDLPFDNDTFDAATVAFGIRNFEDLDKSLQEVVRVLRPEGKLMVLELSVPEHFPVKQGYYLYSKIFIPLIGYLISGNKSAYNYLPKSIVAFPQNAVLAAILEKNGFANVKYQKFLWGVCTLYTGVK